MSNAPHSIPQSILAAWLFRHHLYHSRLAQRFFYSHLVWIYFYYTIIDLLQRLVTIAAFVQKVTCKKWFIDSANICNP
jgi:hypothetical protein